jgi:hypothetical protein
MFGNKEDSKLPEIYIRPGDSKSTLSYMAPRVTPDYNADWSNNATKNA